MVERLDQGAIPPEVCPRSYSALHRLVARALFRAHVEGKLKAEIIQVCVWGGVEGGREPGGGWEGGGRGGAVAGRVAGTHSCPPRPPAPLPPPPSPPPHTHAEPRRLRGA